MRSCHASCAGVPLACAVVLSVLAAGVFVCAGGGCVRVCLCVRGARLIVRARAALRAAVRIAIAEVEGSFDLSDIDAGGGVSGQLSLKVNECTVSLAAR